MKESDRVGLLSKLLIAWNKHPEWRLCQLISNLHGAGRQDIFHTQDEELLRVLDQFNKE